jgi:hypothetical protein
MIRSAVRVNIVVVIVVVIWLSRPLGVPDSLQDMRSR